MPLLAPTMPLLAPIITPPDVAPDVALGVARAWGDAHLRATTKWLYLTVGRNWLERELGRPGTPAPGAWSLAGLPATAHGVAHAWAIRLAPGQWRAAWARTDRTRLVTGYVARLADGTYAHATSARALRALVAARAQAARVSGALVAARARAVADGCGPEQARCVALWTCARTRPVTLADATRAGLCAPGVDAWLTSLGTHRDDAGGDWLIGAVLLGAAHAGVGQWPLLLSACEVAAAR